jgi:Uma2 family endonuclease
MSYALREPRLFTEEEYLTIEDAADLKSEFWYGRIYAMTGASEAHIIINTNLTVVAGIQLRGTPCQVLGNDLKVRTSPGGLLTYPDLTIACGERRLLPRKNAVLLNPTAIFEILSPSTASTDRGEKFLAYQAIESLRDYVLIAQTEARIEHFARQESGFWLPTIAAGLDASLTLSAVPLTLRLAEIYENVNFASTPSDVESDE